MTPEKLAEYLNPSANPPLYYVLPMPDGLAIFGHEIDSYKSELKYGASEQEARYAQKNAARDREQGRIWVQAFSVVVEDGETGTAYLNECERMRITKTMFEQAAHFDWSPPIVTLAPKVHSPDRIEYITLG